MFSHEIDKYIKENNYSVGINALSEIIRNSPQVKHCTFNGQYFMYIITTDDGYAWKVNIYNDISTF